MIAKHLVASSEGPRHKLVECVIVVVRKRLTSCSSKLCLMTAVNNRSLVTITVILTRSLDIWSYTIFDLHMQQFN